VEQLSSDLKQLKLQRKIDKLKKKRKDSKSREVASSSSSNEETNASSEDELKGKKERKGDKRSKRSNNNTSFNYNNLPHSSTSTLVPIGNPPPCFDGLDYTKWKYSMNMHLISLNPSVWTVVCANVDSPKENEVPDFEQLQQIHHNAQASSVLLSSLEKI
jgi:hypothetical protein